MPGEPTVHGAYDYWLGGSTNLRADRERGRAIAERFPGLPVMVNEEHDFHLHAAAWCAERGVSRFIRAGAVTFLDGRNTMTRSAR